MCADELLPIANQRDGAGGYIFGGQGSATAPFTSAGTRRRWSSSPPAAPSRPASTCPSTRLSTAARCSSATAARAGGSIFDALDTLIGQLEDATIDGATLRAGLDAAMARDRHGLDRVLAARTVAGEQLRIMESRGRLLESGELQAASRLADISATDYAAVVSDMQTNQLAVDAAMRTYAQISRLSLFDYL